METNQPKWRIVDNLGDVNPIEYGGYFVFKDSTGVYDIEAELLEAPEDDNGKWSIYRILCDRLKLIDGNLVPFKYDTTWPHPLKNYNEWFAMNLDAVADFQGTTAEELRGMFCSEDPLIRATAYRAVGEYHGFENFDSYPLTLTRSEVNKRYRGILRTLKARRRR